MLTVCERHTTTRKGRCRGLASSGDNMDITRNIKLIEWLKCELLTSIATFNQLLYKGKRGSLEALTDVIANIILVSYLLARRLGITFASVDLKLMSKIKLGITEGHEIEKWYGDLSELSEYMNRNRK